MCSVQFVHVEVFVVALCVSVVWFGVMVVVVFSDFVCPCLHFPFGTCHECWTMGETELL